eukprot:symbB.v1.2.038727.t1/scaffold6145.1/size20566/2
MLRWLFFSLPLVLAQEGTVFSIRFEISADPNAATPQEYFNAMQEAFADAAASDTVGAGGTGGTGIDGASIGGTTGSQIGSQLTLSHFDEGSLLAQVSFTEAVVSRTMKVCDMEPFWEKGQTVYDLRNCRLSPVKMIIWALVPSITLSCGLLGLWSRQRNVRGRGKETKIGSLIACGVSFLSVGYDWFFSAPRRVTAKGFPRHWSRSRSDLQQTFRRPKPSDAGDRIWRPARPKEGHRPAERIVSLIEMAEQQAAQMQNQLNQLMTQVQRLTGELQDSRQRETTLAERLNQVAQQQAQMRVESNLGPLVDAITESQKQVVAALQKDKKLTLIDNRGVAKPDKFGSKDEGFLRWKIRTESFILSVFPELEEALTWAEEHESSITKADVDAEFGATTAGEIEEIHDKSAQVFAVLQNLLEGEAFTIVHNCPKGNGMEAWRKINKRYDPATGSRKGSLLRHILSPAKSKLEDLTGNLEVWLDLISRYENRKDPSGNRVKLQDEIKIAVLEQICPTELERHLQMSKARLKSFEDHREEIMSFLETRLG